MNFTPTEVADAVVVTGEPRTDDRGSFTRVFDADAFRERSLESALVQVNLATTLHPGTVRGLHYQLPPAGEAKLLRCLRGSVFDVVVDLRPWSPTFRRWTGVRLSGDGATAIYVPPGCAHGYQALEPETAVLYHVSARYTPELERGLHHADPGIGISWPLPPSRLSEKDRLLPGIDDAELPAHR